MKSFQSRPPIPIALGGIVVIVLALLAAYNTDKLPLIGSGTEYKAEFAQAAGLRAGMPVKVAGVVVGRVSSVELDDSHVEIAFTSEDAWIGEDSSASIQLGTLLGQRYLAIDPKGSDALAAGGTIPLDRTETPFEIIPTINRLSATVDQIDTDQLAKSLDTLSTTFADTPDDVQGALDGLSRLSTTITKRNDGLSQLLQRANRVSTTVADRDAQVERLIQDVNPLLEELQHRRDAIHTLLVGTRSLGEQLSGLVADNRATLRPALDDLAEVAQVLQQNRKQLDAGIADLGSYIHLFTNTVGIGRWFDAYVCGLVPLPLAGINEKGCQAS